VNANYFTSYAQANGITAATSDIFGCAGVLANDPGHCAALNRHVAHLPQAQWSTPSLYYQAAPANYYAKFWHDHAISHLAYGFPYDDYAGQSSFISHGNPPVPAGRRRLVALRRSTRVPGTCRLAGRQSSKSRELAPHPA